MGGAIWFSPIRSTNRNPYIMHENDIIRLSDLLEAYIYHGPFEMGSDEDRALMKALDIINENL